MTRQKLARLVWKLWKRRNHYKFWYEYEREENSVWSKHFEDRQKAWEEEKHKRGNNT
jgi:hypothetical protein